MNHASDLRSYAPTFPDLSAAARARMTPEQGAACLKQVEEIRGRLVEDISRAKGQLQATLQQRDDALHRIKEEFQVSSREELAALEARLGEEIDACLLALGD